MDDVMQSGCAGFFFGFAIAIGLAAFIAESMKSPADIRREIQAEAFERGYGTYVSDSMGNVEWRWRDERP